MTYSSIKIGRAIFDVVSPLKSLPKYVFLREYDEFYFFDVDASTDRDFIREIERGWKLTPTLPALDFFLSYSSKNEMAKKIDVEQDWVEEVDSFRRKLFENNLHDGIILMPENGSWVMFQKTPVDLGVLAISSKEFRSRQFVQNLDESWFVNSSRIRLALANAEPDLCAALGRPWLEELAANYHMTTNN